MLRVFSFIVLTVFVEHLVDQLQDTRLTVLVLLVGFALLLRALLRSSRRQAKQPAAAAEPPRAAGAGKHAQERAPAPAGVSPARSERAAAAHGRRWR